MAATHLDVAITVKENHLGIIFREQFESHRLLVEASLEFQAELKIKSKDKNNAWLAFLSMKQQEIFFD